MSLEKLFHSCCRIILFHCTQTGQIKKRSAAPLSSPPAKSRLTEREPSSPALATSARSSSSKIDFDEAVSPQPRKKFRKMEDTKLVDTDINFILKVLYIIKYCKFI